MDINKMKISELVKQLEVVAKAYGLKLNRLKDFNFAKTVLVNLYTKELSCEFYEFEND